jgi:putative membrane-bound dehydrogenase-like protein
MNRLPVQHVVLASRWLRRNPNLAFSETVQDCHEREVKTGLRGGGDGVRLHPISSNITTADSHAGSFSAACGVFVWRGRNLGSAYNGKIFSCDPTGNLVHADQLKPNGATFAAAPMFGDREFLASKDDWFRPVYLASGPDGALYVADMYRLVIEHPEYLPQEVRKRTDFESGKAMGRIWRVRDRGAKPSGERVIGPATEERLAALRSEQGWRRQTAFSLLCENPSEPRILRSRRNFARSLAARQSRLKWQSFISSPLLGN